MEKGHYVTITEGKHQGKSGKIIKIKGNNLNIKLDYTNKEVTVQEDMVRGFLHDIFSI